MNLAVAEKVQNRNSISILIFSSTFTRPLGSIVRVSNPKLADTPTPASVNPKARTRTRADTDSSNR